MSEQEVGKHDVLLVGFEGEHPHVSSSRVYCFKCQKPLWASRASMDTVLDKKNELGCKLFFSCMECAPLDQEDAELMLSDAQKAEMLKEGVDIEGWMKQTGLTLASIGRIHSILQRAAKKGKTKGQLEDDLADAPGGGKIPPPDLANLLITFIDKQAPGAIRTGARVKKVNSEKGDRTADGTEGTVLGSLAAPGGAVIIEGHTVHVAYLIQWDGDDTPVATIDLKVEEL
jgi:hypothetical protein